MTAGPAMKAMLEMVAALVDDAKALVDARQHGGVADAAGLLVGAESSSAAMSTAWRAWQR